MTKEPYLGQTLTVGRDSINKNEKVVFEQLPVLVHLERLVGNYQKLCLLAGDLNLCCEKISGRSVEFTTETIRVTNLLDTLSEIADRSEYIEAKMKEISLKIQEALG